MNVSSLPAEPAPRLSAIDEWRGLSVLMVIIHHFTVFRFVHEFNVDYRLSDFVRNPGLANLPHAIDRIYFLWAHNLGALGVQIFFVISGFIITRLLLKEETNTGRICIGCFYTRRVFRILPALIVFVASVALFSTCGLIDFVSPINVSSAAAFLCNTSLTDCGYYLRHLWSLGVEEQFYAFWPLLYVLIVPVRRPLFACLILAVCMGLSIVARLFVGGWLNNGLAFACIAAGCLYALSERFRNLLGLFKHVPYWLLLALLLVALPLLKSLIVSVWAPLALITPVAIVAVVLGRAAEATTRSPGVFARWLREVGKISYSLYLWHFIFTWEPERYHSRALFFASIPLGLVMAWVSARYIETYFTRYGRSLAVAGATRSTGLASSS